ncbi:MAG: S-layer homology domain-containing protein [SAR324 cluster bacterium]|nr:S-layer homology domain-containing protein [SAR324 cluster bacterium]
MFTKKWLTCVIGLFVLTLWIAGCSSQPKLRKQQSKLDDPEHHALRGRDLIKDNRWKDARREFRLALEIDDKYSPALAGQALVNAHETTLAGKSAEEKEKDAEQAMELLDGSFDHAKNDRQKAHAHVMAIRVLSMLKAEEDWLDDAEGHFEDAVDLYQDEDNIKFSNLRAEPHFYMAEAYRDASEFSKAITEYSRVLELNLGFTREADQALEQLQKMIRAEPGSRLGKRISRSPTLTRGDMAAMLVEELRLPQLYGRDAAKQKYNTSFKPPTKQFVTQQKREIPVATDIEAHPLRSDIEQILDTGVRGLEASPQHLFYPDETIIRSEFAIMLEDILIQVTKDRSLSTRFIGDTSPWPDVRPDAFYYNAARTLVSRNIMTVTNKTRGEFGPNEPVKGADALLSIRLLKDELENYIRKPES